METIDYFRQQAARCRHLAQEVFDFKVTRRLFDLAEEFEEKVEEIIQRQERRERSLEWSALNALMVDNILFMYEAATELRDIVTIAPEIAAKLCRMAEELEGKADELARTRRDRFDRAEAP
jgi:hypothetical protein